MGWLVGIKQGATPPIIAHDGAYAPGNQQANHLSEEGEIGQTDHPGLEEAQKTSGKNPSPQQTASGPPRSGDRQTVPSGQHRCMDYPLRGSSGGGLLGIWVVGDLSVPDLIPLIPLGQFQLSFMAISTG